MGKTYSQDLREKAVAYIENQGDKKEAAEIFAIDNLQMVKAKNLFIIF